MRFMGIMIALLLFLSSFTLIAYQAPFPVKAAHEDVIQEVTQVEQDQPVEQIQKEVLEEIPIDYTTYDEWIIKWTENTAQPTSDDFTVLTVDAERNLMLIKLSEEVQVEEWYTKWSEKEEIQYVEPNHTLKISFRPNDSDVSKQQYLTRIGAIEGWKTERENRELTIAILDTGIDLGHPDLKDNLVPGINLIERTKPPQDDNGHGTQIAGVLGAKGNNNQGIAGILWSAKMMPVKVLDKEGEGTPFRVSQGIYQSVEKGASIVLLSLGDPVFSQTLKDAVEKAEKEGVLVIAATGNEGARVNYPAAFPTVFTVGAVDANDRTVSYSNSGPEVNVVASGSVYTTRLHGGYGVHSGTSMAAPQVAGLAALIWKRYPNLTPSEVRHHIMYTSKDVHTKGWDPQTGHGRIDIGNALQTRPVADIYEPNDVISQAAPFPIETMVRAELRNKEDVDWFRIDAPYRGKIDLQVTLDMAKQNGVDLTFYPSGQGGQSYLYNVKKERDIELTVTKGTSYIRVKYHHNERRATPLKYDMVHSFSVYADSQQPNNRKAQATRLQGTGQVLTGTFHQDYLNHWYYFDVPQQGQVELYLTVDTLRLDPVLFFERPDGKTQTIDNGNVQNGQEEYLVTEVSPGRHYFRVSNYYGYKVNGEYYLRYTYRPMFEDTYEPNNTMNRATGIQTGQNIEANIRPRTDVDWYQVQVSNERYLQVQMTSIPAQVGLEVKLMNDKQEVIVSRKQAGNERGFVFGDKVDAGTYYVVVSADREFAFDSYSFRVNAVELLFGFRDISGHWAVLDIIDATRKDLVQGVGDYRFAPNEGMNRAAVATLMNRLYSFPNAMNPARFNDVPSSHWAAQAIRNVNSQGIIQGYPNGTFQPNRSITRAEVAVIFDRLLNNNQEYTSVAYTDLQQNHWAYTSIMRLSADRLLSGYQDGSFRPNQPMTRAEFVTLVKRLNK